MPDRQRGAAIGGEAYGRWVEAEKKLKETPAILKMPSGYLQQNPWLTIATRQLELMHRYMVELGLAGRWRKCVGDGRNCRRHRAPGIPSALGKSGDAAQVVLDFLRTVPSQRCCGHGTVRYSRGHAGEPASPGAPLLPVPRMRGEGGLAVHAELGSRCRRFPRHAA